MLNDDDRPLALSGVQGFMFYGQSQDIEDLPVDFYYLYTDEDSDAERITHTWGTRLLPQFSENLSGDFEVAFQRGEDGGNAQQGQLLYSALKYRLSELNFIDSIKLGFYHLSGDDPDTDKNEAWNSTLSGWPQFSTLAVIAAAGSKQGKNRLHNFSSPFVEVGVPLPYGDLKLSYWKMLADTNDNSDFNKDKGDLFVMKYVYPVSKGFTFEVCTEYMQPGEYYPDDVGDAFYMRIRFKYVF